MVLTNGKVYTPAGDRPLATTLVIEERVLTYVGAADPPVVVDGSSLHDLGGRTVVPAFVDAHTHPSLVTRSSWHVRLPWTTDVDEILDFIRGYAREHPPSEAPFLYFEYYPTATFGDRAPTKELLDSAVSDRPCLCQDFSEHAHWVNSRMLELMGITRDTPDPVPGLEMFDRDEDGEPTGHLRESVHERFIEEMYEAIGWRPPEEITPERVREVLRFMTEHGVTALFEAMVEDDQILQAITELDRLGELNMYYEGAVRFRDMRDLPGAIAQLKRYESRYGGEHVRLNTLKLFLDGTNESGNGAVLEPLRGPGGGLGEIAMEVAELTECLLLCNAEGVDVHIHLVGDRAFRVACDAVEAARERLRAAWTIQVTLAHCELVDPADMARPAELGVFVNWTPHWSGGYFGEGSARHLGRERWDRMYRFNEIAQSGAVLGFGSDVVTAYELHRADPLLGMQIAHTRIDPEYTLDPAVYPGGRRPPASAELPRDLLLKGYTIGGARQLRLDDKLGSLEVGKLANLVVLRRDPFEVEPDRLGSVEVDAVLFEGEVVAGSL